MKTKVSKAPEGRTLAVLISGGLDSAILLGKSLQDQEAVFPLYIRTGLFWESVELRHLRRFLKALSSAALRPLQVLDLPVRDLYGPHWSITGKNVPDESSQDEAVFLPGRNVLLLAKAMLWCHLHDVGSVALGSLQSNPFPDATPEFFARYQEVVNQAVQGKVKIRRPFAGVKKKEVMRLAGSMPLRLTFSCIRPVGQLHCGRCNKCAERQHSFADSGLKDPTKYYSEPEA